MRRDPVAARLIAAAAIAAAAGVAQLLPPRIADSLAPATADVLVGCVLAAVAVLITRRRRPLPAIALALAAAAWILVGLAPLIGGPVEDPLLRAALLPHALVVAVLLTAPSGRVADRRTAVLVALVLAVGVVAGTGRLPLPLLAIGVVSAIGALPPRDPPQSVARAGFGLLLAAVDLLGTVGPMPAAAVANTVDIGILAVVATLPRLLDRETRLWAVAAETGSDLVGLRLGRALHGPPLRLAIPLEHGGWIDPAGEAIAAPEDGREVHQEGRVVAVLRPPIRIDPLLEQPLARLLEHVAAVARGRSRQRALAEQLARSHRLLVLAGEEERRDLEERVRTTVGDRIAAIRTTLEGLGGADDAVRRAEITRLELLRVGAAPVTSDADAFAAALLQLAGPDATVRVAIDEPIPEAIGQVLWFTCAEGLANAAKHAPGAAVTVEVLHRRGTCSATVVDTGGGGATADGAGLRGIADRAGGIGGAFSLRSDGSGTRLSVSVPSGAAGPGTAAVRVSPDAAVTART